MSPRMSLLSIIGCTVWISAVLVCGTATALPVTITGGFTSFDGVVLGSGNDNFPLSTINGQPLCATAGCATTANAHVEFASAQTSLLFQNSNDGISTNEPNLVQFTPAAPQEVLGVGPGNPFLLGTLTYANGIWSGDATFGFSLTTQSADPLLDGQILTDLLTLVITPNDFVAQTPEQNADFVYFSGAPAIGSLRAYELADSPTGTNTVTASIFGFINSLHLFSLADARGGGFLDPGIDIAPTPPNPVPVPEPSPFALLSVGLLLMLYVPWTRRRVRS